MMSLGFIFGGNTGETQESLARKRAVAEAMMERSTLDDLPLHCVERMLAKAIEALEISTGTSAGLFTGTSPLLN